MDVNRQDINTSVEHSKRSTTSDNSRHHGGSRRHSHKPGFLRRLKRRVFRRKYRVSGVKQNQVNAERKVMMWFIIVAIVLLLVLIPFFTWIAEIVRTSSTV